MNQELRTHMAEHPSEGSVNTLNRTLGGFLGVYSTACGTPVNISLLPMTHFFFTRHHFFVLSLVTSLWWLSLTACGQQSPTAITALSPTEFAKRSQQEVVVLDVRTPAEYERGHLATAQPLNFYDKQLDDRIARLDTHHTYLIYCTVGQRSQRVAELMARKGFKHLYHLQGGLQAWQQAGYPVTQ